MVAHQRSVVNPTAISASCCVCGLSDAFCSRRLCNLGEVNDVNENSPPKSKAEPSGALLSPVDVVYRYEPIPNGLSLRPTLVDPILAQIQSCLLVK